MGRRAKKQAVCTRGPTGGVCYVPSTVALFDQQVLILYPHPSTKLTNFSLSLTPVFDSFFCASQVVTKKKPKLAKLFKCPFCSNDEAVECKMDFKMNIGSLSCRICGAAYQMPIHHLHEPIDVFSEWLDDCEAAANPHRNAAANSATDAAAPQYAEEGEDELLDDDDDELQGSGLSGPARAQSNKKPAAASNSKSSNNNRSIDLGLSSDEDDDDE